LLSPDWQNWSWARLHTIRFHHPLDRLPGAEKLLDLGPLSRPGDGYTVNATSVGEKFQQQAGASYREILDTADWDRSLAVNTPGQSGQSGSPHYSPPANVVSHDRETNCPVLSTDIFVYEGRNGCTRPFGALITVTQHRRGEQSCARTCANDRDAEVLKEIRAAGRLSEGPAVRPLDG
jgi:hypothetical protein